MKDMLTDNDEFVRSAAIIALGESGDKSYLPLIWGKLIDESQMVRYHAVKVLIPRISKEEFTNLYNMNLEGKSMDLTHLAYDSRNPDDILKYKYDIKKDILDNAKYDFDRGKVASQYP